MIDASAGGAQRAADGVEDHVHALVGLHASVDVARLVRELKAPSSAFARRALGLRDFAWQEGYSAFTLRANEVDTVRRYILDQPRHHVAGMDVAEWELAPTVGSIEYDRQFSPGEEPIQHG